MYQKNLQKCLLNVSLVGFFFGGGGFNIKQKNLGNFSSFYEEIMLLKLLLGKGQKNMNLNVNLDFIRMLLFSS